MPYKHTDEIPLSEHVGANIRSAGEEGFLTDAGINPLTTVAGLKGLITGGHADQLPSHHRHVRGIEIGEALGDLSDAGIAAANTVAGVIALTSGNGKAERVKPIE